MKKASIALLLTCLLLTPSLSWADAAPIQAENAYVSLKELGLQAKAGWQETKTALGREVKVRVSLPQVPDAGSCPIVLIAYGEVDKARLDPYQGQGNRAQASLKYHSVDIAVDSNKSTWYKKGFSGAYGGLMDQDVKQFGPGETPKGTPEGLSLTCPQLLEVLDGHLMALTGQGRSAYWLSGVGMGGVVYSAKREGGQIVRKKPMTQSGSFHVTGWRSFHGIPLQWAWEGPYGYLVFNYYGERCYDLNVHPLAESALLSDDVPLLSFPSLQDALRKQMDAGCLRGVDEMQFCYLPFPQAQGEGEHFALRPVWRIKGWYYENPKQETQFAYTGEKDADGSLTLPEEYNDYFFDAQTGAMIPTFPLDRHRKPPVDYPDFLTWEAVREKPR